MEINVMEETAIDPRTEYIIRQRRAGKTIREIATALNRSGNLIYRILKRHNVVIPQPTTILERRAAQVARLERQLERARAALEDVLKVSRDIPAAGFAFTSARRAR